MNIAGFGLRAVAAAALCSMAAPAWAQEIEAVLETDEAEAGGAEIAAAADAVPVAPAAEALVIPKLTPVFLELMEEVSSATATSGDRFRLKLITPIAVGDRVVVQAGTEGVGEVVHAKKKGGSGAGGELILAARYLELADGRQLPLRSMTMIATGKDADTKVQVVNQLVGPFGLMVKGRDTVISAGRQAQAKVRKDFSIDLAAPEPAAATGNGIEEVSEIAADEAGGTPDSAALQGVE